MFSYSTYGFCIHSEIPLSSLPAGGPDPDLTIFRRRFQNGRAPYSTDSRSVIGGRIDPDLYFWIYDGREIYLDAETTLDADSMGTYVVGLIISAALRQRGFLVLHASCVVKEGRAIGFVGDCGYGKSTLASYFHGKGYHMYNDDVMAIELTSERPVALPGSSHIKLRHDAGSWLHDGFDRLPRVYPSSGKRIQYAETSDSAPPVPITRLYLLQPRAARQNAIEEVRSAEAVRALIENTRVRNLFDHPEEMRMLLKQCARLGSAVRIRILQRKKGLEHLSDIYDLVDQDACGATGTDKSRTNGHMHIAS